MMIRRLRNKKGMTLTELIVAMLVMSIIMLAVTTVFLPIYNAYVNANELAEINSLLNSLSSYVMSDLENAREVPDFDDNTLVIDTRITVTYATNGDNILTRNAVPILDAGFYKRKGARIAGFTELDGVFTIELALVDRNNVEIIRRSYSAKPIGLQ